MSTLRTDYLQTLDNNTTLDIADIATKAFFQSPTGAQEIGYGNNLTVADKLSELFSVKDTGATGDGVSDDTPAFQAANDSFANGTSGFVYVPDGNYKLNTDVVANGRTVTFLCAAGAVFSGVGKLQVNFVKYDAYGGQYGITRHGFGSNAKGGGILVGGGAFDEGGQGTYLANDGHANWLRAQTSINYNPTELVIYGAGGQGRAVSVVGTAFIDRTAGTVFDPAWVGRPLYFNRRTYVVKAWVSDNRLELEELGGGVVSFVAATFAAFHYIRTTGTGTCSISGTTVTRLTGQPFIPFISYAGFEMTINGSAVTVSSFTDTDHLTLSSAPGDQASVPYTYELDINAQISTIRVQKTFGTDEENLTIAAKATGEYEVRVGGSGNGENYPLRFYNGSIAPYTPRPVAIMNEAGRFGVSNSQQFSPVVLSEVLSNRPEALGSSVYNEAYRVSTVWNNTDIRGLEFGTFSNGSQGGYIQGRDYSTGLYDIALNPRGGNVGVGLNNPTLKLTVGGHMGPATDNSFTSGTAGLRWSAVWAANGTIQTSQRDKKTDIESEVLGLDFINSLNPVSYKFKSGGNVVTEELDGYDEIEQQATELVTEYVQVNEIKVVDGKNVLVGSIKEQQVEKPLFDTITDLYDEAGHKLPDTKVPRMVKIKIPRYKTVVTEKPGVRVHHGFLADEVKKAADEAGIDFGGYVIDKNGEEGLRYDQFNAPLVKAVQELSSMVVQLRKELDILSSRQ